MCQAEVISFLADFVGCSFLYILSVDLLFSGALARLFSQ